MKLEQTEVERQNAFFRDYLSDPAFVLPEITVFSNAIIDRATELFRFAALTLSTNIFMHSRYVTRLESGYVSVKSDLLTHEIIHCQQYKRQGLLGFLFHYLADFTCNFTRYRGPRRERFSQAYLAIPAEIDARRAEEAFCSQLELI
jgi:hypothetical protein